MKGKNKFTGKGKDVVLSSDMDAKEAEFKELDIKKLLKDIEFLGSSNMTWKERKELENRKVVSLGGKPPKKHRIPLSVARVTMKKQKEKEQKMLKEGMVLGRFGAKSASSSSRVAEKRKAEDRVLKTSQGHFSKGVLDVKELLRHDRYGSNESNSRPMGGGGKKHKGSKKKGKKNGKKGGKKRR